MPSDNRLWAFRVEQMLDIIARIGEHTMTIEWEEFRSRQILIDAVVRNLIILGVAARHVPERVAAAHPGVPWRELQAIGVALDNSYARTDAEMVWHAIRNALPPLIPKLQAVLAKAGIQQAEGSPRPKKGLFAKPPGGRTPRDY